MMKMSFKYRVHEWLADHVDSIQYPQPRRRKPLFQWKYQMSIMDRITLFMVSLWFIIVFSACLAVLLLLFYAFLIVPFFG
jgi:hypothetical protein